MTIGIDSSRLLVCACALRRVKICPATWKTCAHVYVSRSKVAQTMTVSFLDVERGRNRCSCHVKRKISKRNMSDLERLRRFARKRVDRLEFRGCTTCFSGVITRYFVADSVING